MSTSVYRAEPIGSLLRPAWLIDARKALRRGELSAAGYKKIEDRAVADAIELQERCGLDVVNDGEQRRLSFLGSLVETTEGLTRTSALVKALAYERWQGRGIVAWPRGDRSPAPAAFAG